MTGLLCLSVWMLFHLRQKCSVINYDFQGGGWFFKICLNKDHLLLLINQILLCFYRKYVLQFVLFYHFTIVNPFHLLLCKSKWKRENPLQDDPQKKQERNGFST